MYGGPERRFVAGREGVGRLQGVSVVVANVRRERAMRSDHFIEFVSAEICACRGDEGKANGEHVRRPDASSDHLPTDGGGREGEQARRAYIERGAGGYREAHDKGASRKGDHE